MGCGASSGRKVATPSQATAIEPEAWVHGVDPFRWWDVDIHQFQREGLAFSHLPPAPEPESPPAPEVSDPLVPPPRHSPPNSISELQPPLPAPAATEISEPQPPLPAPAATEGGSSPVPTEETEIWRGLTLHPELCRQAWLTCPPTAHSLADWHRQQDNLEMGLRNLFCREQSPPPLPPDCPDETIRIQYGSCRYPPQASPQAASRSTSALVNTTATAYMSPVGHDVVFSAGAGATIPAGHCLRATSDFGCRPEFGAYGRMATEARLPEFAPLPAEVILEKLQRDTSELLRNFKALAQAVDAQSSPRGGAAVAPPSAAAAAAAAAAAQASSSPSASASVAAAAAAPGAAGGGSSPSDRAAAHMALSLQGIHSAYAASEGQLSWREDVGAAVEATCTAATEISLGRVDGISDRAYLSVKIDNSRRQAKVSGLARQPMVIPTPTAGSQLTFGFTILNPVARSCFVLHPNKYRYRIPFRTDSGRALLADVTVSGHEGCDLGRSAPFRDSAEEYFRHHRVMEFMEGLFATALNEQHEYPYRVLEECIEIAERAEGVSRQCVSPPSGMDWVIDFHDALPEGSVLCLKVGLEYRQARIPADRRIQLTFPSSHLAPIRLEILVPEGGRKIRLEPGVEMYNFDFCVKDGRRVRLDLSVRRTPNQPTSTLEFMQSPRQDRHDYLRRHGLLEFGPRLARELATAQPANPMEFMLRLVRSQQL